MEQQSNTATQKKGSLLLPILAMACHLLLPVTFMLILMINLMINESLYAALGLGSSALSAWLQTLLIVLQYGLSMYFCTGWRTLNERRESGFGFFVFTVLKHLLCLT